MFIFEEYGAFNASSLSLIKLFQRSFVFVHFRSYIFLQHHKVELRKQAYSNILKILPPKNEKNFIKILTFFQISAQNIDCGYSLEPPRRGGSNEYPQSMFLSRNKKINVYPCKPQFCYIKVGLKGINII